MQISATNIPLEKNGLNCLRRNYQQNIIQLTLLLEKSCCNYTFPLTETTLKFTYPEKTAWIGGTIGIIGDNSIIGVDQEKSLGLSQESTWNGLYQHRPTQTGVRKCLVGPTLQKRYFNLGESSKKSCSFLPSKLHQNSKCDRHVIWSEMGHIRNKTKEKQIDFNVQT